MVANGTNPYWEDTDANNKHWVFPGRPDLEEAANTRKANLDADDDDNFEYASDLDEEDYPRVTISNITESKVGQFTDDATNMGEEVISENVSNETEQTNTESSGGSDYDDLPF